jgi:hypothetical protein
MNIKNKQNHIVHKNFISIKTNSQIDLKVVKDTISEIMDYKISHIFTIDFAKNFSEKTDITYKKAQKVVNILEMYIPDILSYKIAKYYEDLELEVSEDVTFVSFLNNQLIDSKFYFMNELKIPAHKVDYLRHIKINLKNSFLEKDFEEKKTKALNEIKNIIGEKFEYFSNMIYITSNESTISPQLENPNNNTSEISDCFYLNGVIRLDSNSSIQDNIYDLLIDESKTNDVNIFPKNSIAISFPANIIFDVKEMENCHFEKGTKDYIELLKKKGNENKPLKLGSNYQLFDLINKARSLLGLNIFPIKIGLITKNEPFDAKIFYKSQYAYNIKFDYSAFTGGENRAHYNFEFGVKLAFCSNEKSKYEHELSGVNSFNTNVNKKTLDDLYEDRSLLALIDFLINNIKDEQNIETLINTKKYVLENNIENFKIKNIIEKNNLSLYKTPKTKYENSKITNDINYLIDGDALFVGSKTSQIYSLLKKKIILKEILKDSEFNVFIHIASSKDYYQKILNLLIDTGNESNVNLVLGSCSDILNLEKIDLYISSNEENVRESIKNHISAIKVTPKSMSMEQELSLDEKPFNMVFDLDEVITQGDEIFYQEFHLIKFKKEQENRLHIQLKTSIMYDYFFKVGKVAKHLKENPNANLILNIEILTARGGDECSLRFFNLMDYNNIYIDRALFLDGRDKSVHLKNLYMKGGVTLFADDHPTHINRLNKSMEKDNFIIVDGHCISGINNGM